MKTERVGSRRMARTGWTTPERRCPAHGTPLELCFDETDYGAWSEELRPMFDHDDNRVQWRCDACVGAWTEGYFLSSDPAAAAARAKARLVLKCPRCGSRRVGHTCMAECCEEHACQDCHAHLDGHVTVTKAGPKGFVSRAPGPHLAVMMSVGEAPAVRSGVKRRWRRCGVHDTPMELVFVSLVDGRPGPLAVAWRCGRCRRSTTESTFRRLRRGFVAEVSAGGKCPACRSTALESLGASGARAQCAACGAQLDFKLTLA
jgi:Zn finger protein HypA/HybF involved in hydrogenase expression